MLLGLAPYYVLRGTRESEGLKGWSERLGLFPPAVNPQRMTGIWIQAVSVGEVMLARDLMAGIRGRAPDARLYLSTTTPAGRGLARRVTQPEALVYFPLDLKPAVRRTLDRLQPALFIALETEIWPNLLRAWRAGASPRWW